MCNLYSIITDQAAIIALFRVVNRYVGDLAPMPGVFPDYQAPIARNGRTDASLAMEAMAVIRYARKHGTQKRPWLGRLMERRPTKGRSPTRLRGWPGPSWSGARDTRNRNYCWRHDAHRQIERQHQWMRA